MRGRPRDQRPVDQRLFAGADHNPATGCWEWRSARDYSPNAYGSIGINGKAYAAHRVAYELWIGPIPKGLEIDHLCHVRCCINPHHLEAVTHSENLKRTRRAIQARKRGWESGEERKAARQRYHHAIEEERQEKHNAATEQVLAQYPHLARYARPYPK